MGTDTHIFFSCLSYYCCEITCHLNGGESSSNNKAYYEAGYSTGIYDPKLREGYRFNGWYIDEHLSQRLEEHRITADMTGPANLYARWEAVTYQVIYYGLQ